jgi:hypothetical protein
MADKDPPSGHRLRRLLLSAEGEHTKVERLRQSLSRLLIAAVVTTFALFTLVGCVADPPVPPHLAMVGTWVHGDGSSRITLEASGKAAFTRVPKQLLVGITPSVTDVHIGPWADLMTAAGT